MKICGFKNTRIHLEGASERDVSKSWVRGQGLSFSFFLFFFFFFCEECCFRVRVRVRVDTNPNPKPNPKTEVFVRQKMSSKNISSCWMRKLHEKIHSL